MRILDFFVFNYVINIDIYVNQDEIFLLGVALNSLITFQTF